MANARRNAETAQASQTDRTTTDATAIARNAAHENRSVLTTRLRALSFIVLLNHRHHRAPQLCFPFVDNPFGATSYDMTIAVVISLATSFQLEQIRCETTMQFQRLPPVPRLMTQRLAQRRRQSGKRTLPTIEHARLSSRLKNGVHRTTVHGMVHDAGAIKMLRQQCMGITRLTTGCPKINILLKAPVATDSVCRWCKSGRASRNSNVSLHLSSI